jgi:hypothetical protein
LVSAGQLSHDCEADASFASESAQTLYRVVIYGSKGGILCSGK